MTLAEPNPAKHVNFNVGMVLGVDDFTQEPTDHFYGTDMGLRDPFGNAIRILQQGKVAQKVTA